MTSRNQREGWYAGRFQQMDEDTSRHHRLPLNSLCLKHIYDPPTAEQVARLTAKVLELIKEQDAKP